MKREIKAVQFEVGLLCPIAASYTAPFSGMHCTKHIRIFKLGAAYMMVSIILSKVWMPIAQFFPRAKFLTFGFHWPFLRSCILTL